MKIQIDYANGASEVLNVRLEGGVVSFAARWIPGMLVDEPKLCYMKSDFFEAALNEGGQRSGSVSAMDDDPSQFGFCWNTVGDEKEACHEKLTRWARRVGPIFNPQMIGKDYFYEGILWLLSHDEAAQYDRDRACWLYYLSDTLDEASSV